MDRKEAPRSVRKSIRLNERIATLKEEMQRLKALDSQMQASPDGQVSLTDPDARSMASQGKGARFPRLGTTRFPGLGTTCGALFSAPKRRQEWSADVQIAAISRVPAAHTATFVGPHEGD